MAHLLLLIIEEAVIHAKQQLIITFSLLINPCSNVNTNEIMVSLKKSLPWNWEAGYLSRANFLASTNYATQINDEYRAYFLTTDPKSTSLILFCRFKESYIFPSTSERVRRETLRRVWQPREKAIQTQCCYMILSSLLLHSRNSTKPQKH